VLNRDVVVDDDRVGKPGPVEIAFDFGRDNSLTITVRSIDDFEGDLGIEDIAVTPGLDRGATAEFPAGVVYEGDFSEEGIERRRIVIVDRSDVFGGDWGQLHRHGFISWFKESRSLSLSHSS